MILEARAVKLIGTGLRGHRHRRSSGHTLLRVKRTSADIHGVDGLDWRNINHIVGQPDVDVGRAIHPCVVIVPRSSVDVGSQGSCWGRAHAVLEICRSGPRDEVDQALEIAIGGKRKILHRAAGDFGVDVGLVRLEGAGERLDGDLLGELSELEPDADTGHVVDGDLNTGLGERAEPGSSHFQVEAARQQIGEGVAALRINLGLTNGSSAFIRHGDGGSGDDSAALVKHRADG